jgi:ATP/ADP translocase
MTLTARMSLKIIVFMKIVTIFKILMYIIYKPLTFKQSSKYINSVVTLFLEFASLIGLLLYSICSRLWLSIKALIV